MEDSLRACVRPLFVMHAADRLLPPRAMTSHRQTQREALGASCLAYRAPMISQTVWARGALRLISMERIPKSRIWTQAPGGIVVGVMLINQLERLGSCSIPLRASMLGCALTGAIPKGPRDPVLPGDVRALEQRGGPRPLGADHGGDEPRPDAPPRGVEVLRRDGRAAVFGCVWWGLG